MRRLLVPHLALWVLGAAFIRIAVVPAEACPPAEPHGVRAAAVAAGDWLARGLDDEGKFVYGYDRAADLVSSDYSIVRHAGATVILYQLTADTDQRFLEPAEAALGWLLDQTVETSTNASAIAGPGSDARLGTTAFMIIALIRRRSISGDVTYDDLLRRLGRFVIEQSDGRDGLLAFWNPTSGNPVPDAYGPFATGEAVWALAELDSIFVGEGWGDQAVHTLRYLARGERERREGYLSRLPDHWAAYALEALEDHLFDDELRSYARRLAGYVSLRLRFEAQRRGEGINLWVRWYPGPPAGVGTAGEALAALHRLAQRDKDLTDLVPDMTQRLACMGGFMVDRQVKNIEAAGGPRPELTEGAWFYRDYTQVDGQQHVISALLGAAAAMEGER
jgi:hypothetical protein